MIEFAKVLRHSELLAPPAFERDSQSIEYRQDPLTGVRCRLNVRRARRPRQGQEPADISQVIQKPSDCPFCPENIEQATPQFTADLCPQGRIKRGQSCLFPNLFPFAEHHATATLTHDHFLPLDGFHQQLLEDNLSAAAEYLAIVHRRDKAARFPLYIWNHLPPSAASIVHPHVQILVERRPTTYQRRLLAASGRYFRKAGSNYWQDLVAEERRRGERYIGDNRSLSVIACYAPQGNREVQIIFKEASNLLDLDERQTSDFAEAVVKVLRGYHRMGASSLNLSTFSAAMGHRLEHYSLNAKIISRPALQPFYKNDAGFLERLHYEADIELEPEALARALRAHF